MPATTAHQQSVERYRRHAQGYDASARRTMALRLRTIALLRLQPGEVVLDVGAGTGLSYAPLLEAVGPGGRVLAFEQSPEMFALAEQRVRRHDWQQVWHRQAAAETVRLPVAADAVLFNYVHDICCSPLAVANILRQVKPGARVALAGMKFFPWWTGPLNLLVWLKNRPYSGHPANLWRPWHRIEACCSHFDRQTTQTGMGYIAAGTLREAAR